MLQVIFKAFLKNICTYLYIKYRWCFEILNIDYNNYVLLVRNVMVTKVASRQRLKLRKPQPQLSSFKYSDWELTLEEVLNTGHFCDIGFEQYKEAYTGTRLRKIVMLLWFIVERRHKLTMKYLIILPTSYLVLLAKGTAEPSRTNFTIIERRNWRSKLHYHRVPVIRCPGVAAMPERVAVKYRCGPEEVHPWVVIGCRPEVGARCWCGPAEQPFHRARTPRPSG